MIGYERGQGNNYKDNEKKTIWIINQYASHLMTRHEELSKSFASAGYHVAVITSSFHHGRREYIYDAPVVFKELYDNVTYIYIHSGPNYLNNGAKRVLNMIDFCWLIQKHQEEIVKKVGSPSFVIASSAPPFVWDVGYKIAKKNRAKFVVEFRDIWPLSLVDIQGVSPRHPLVLLMNSIEKKAYKRADAIVSTMPFAWKHVHEVAGVPKERVHWMPNGINIQDVKADLQADLNLPKELEEYLEKHWCCVYIGSIVKSECIDYLLRAFSEVEDNNIYFAIIGEGHEKEKMQKLASELDITNIKFFPAINKHLIPKALSLAKVAVAAHDDLSIYQFGLSMNKLNDYLASGKPTVFVCNAPNVVEEAGHFAINKDNEIELARTIEKVKTLTVEELNKLDESAKSIIRRDYDYPEIGKKYLTMLEEL